MSKTIKLFFWPLVMVWLTVCMFLFPQATYAGARFGLETWALTLAPSLLPFMIAANMLIALGVVRFLGVFLEPLMRPVFKQPGEAGFAVAMGFTSGFPMGAILTASLREKNICTAREAARLVTFTNNASPLFLLVAIPVGMLGAPRAGIILLIAHYSANLLIGIIGGLLARPETTLSAKDHDHLLRRSLDALLTARREAPPLGTVLADAVNKGLQSIMSIGGFVLFFSVTIEILDTVGFFSLTNALFSQVLDLLRLEVAFAPALSNGLLEMTLGAKAAAACGNDLFTQVVIISLILGWSGLSIHAQVGSIIAASGISVLPYTLCRIVQGILAALIAALLMLLAPATITALPSMPHFAAQPSLLCFLIVLPLGNLALLLVLSLLCVFWGRLKKIMIINTHRRK